MELPDGPDIEESPYLKAIQGLNGQKPGEKYRHLNEFIRTIIKICRETGVSPADVIKEKEHETPAALLPLVRILTGVELKLMEAVVEGLRSSDIVVVNKALRAKWFFDGSNSHVDAPYFMENIFSFVSVRTRMDIVKALTSGLYNAEGKAENFFNLFLDMYGLEQAMPFLPYCSEKFIFDTILKFKIILTFKVLDKIFQRYPKLAIRYLNLGCNTIDFTSDSKFDPDKHTINLSAYEKFLPKLIKNHMTDYLELIEYVNYKHDAFGSTRRRALVKNAKDFVMKSNMPLKYFYYRLSKAKFAKYYVSLHPNSQSQYNFSTMFGYLKYYPKGQRVDFMKKHYEKVYKKDFFSYSMNVPMLKIAALFNDAQISENEFEILYSHSFPPRHLFKLNNVIFHLKNYSNEKLVELLHRNMKQKRIPDLLNINFSDFDDYQSESYLLLLPNEEKVKNAEHLISFCHDRTDSYYKWCCYLSVEQSFEILKFGAESSKARKRIDFLKKMIYSCKIFNDQTHLSKVLKYYIERHKNEQSSCLYSILAYLLSEFNILDFNEVNWQLFYRIVESAYVKNELFNAPVDLVDKIFEGSLHRLSVNAEQLMQVESMMCKYLEFKIIHRDDTDWKILETIPDLEGQFLKLLIPHIPIFYPDNHEIWKEHDKKLKVGLRILQKLHNRNLKIINSLTLQEREASDLNIQITRVSDYPWFMKVSKNLLQEPNLRNSWDLTSFKDLMKIFDEEFYLSVIPNDTLDDPRANIILGKARSYLKNDSSMILNYWEEYFNTARNMLVSKSIKGGQAAKNFIISTKWHQELPLRFAKRCISEIKKPGSLTILALLVDGDTLSKFLSNYVPYGPSVDINKINANEDYRFISFIPASINVSVPFVSTDILITLLQDEYTKLGQRSVRTFGRRVDKVNVVKFAKLLIDKPVSVKKHGIRLMFSVLTINEIDEFLTELIKYKQNGIVNIMIANYVFNHFIKYPNDKSWNLMHNFLDILSYNDHAVLNILTNTKLICNSYASLYIKKLLSKIEDLNEQYKQMKMEKELNEASIKKPRLKPKEKSFKENLINAVFENASENSLMFLTKETITDILRTYYFRTESNDIKRSLIKFSNKLFARPFIVVNNLFTFTVDYY